MILEDTEQIKVKLTQMSSQMFLDKPNQTTTLTKSPTMNMETMMMITR